MNSTYEHRKGIRKILAGMTWSVLAFGVLGISGTAINLLIGRYYGTEVLGGFNQIFAFYVLVSQIASFGIHLSVLKHVSEFADDIKEVRLIVLSAVLVALFTSVLVMLLSTLSDNLISQLLDSKMFSDGWILIAPALVFFTLNKIGLAALNGTGRMRALAFGQMARYVLIAIGVLSCAVAKVHASTLPLTVTIAEAVLCIGIMITLQRTWANLGAATGLRSWCKRHVGFSAKGCLGGTISVLNLRADILILGYFLDDTQVGVYSFASTIVEGFVQLAVTIRQPMNPILTQLYMSAKYRELENLVRTSVIRTYAFFCILGVLAILLYPFLLQIVGVSDLFSSGHLVFSILMIGFMARSGYVPAWMLLIQTGKPALQTIFFVTIFLAKIVLAIPLVMYIGLEGMAIATTVTFTLAIVLFKKIARHQLGLRI